MISPGLYLFLGPDRFRQRQRVDALIDALKVHALDRHEVLATHLSAAELATLLREYPLVSPARLVIIDEALRLDGACVTVLTAQMEAGGLMACVILLIEGDLPQGHPLEAVQARATIEPFPWLSESEVGRWVAREVARSKKHVSPRCASALWQRYGADLAAIRSLLDQLIPWAGTRTELTIDDLQVFAPAPSQRGVESAGGRPQASRAVHGQSSRGGTKRRQAGSPTVGAGDPQAAAARRKQFALLNAIGRKDPVAALRALHEELVEGREGLEVAGSLGWQLQRWLSVKHLLTMRCSRDQIADQLGLQAWQVERVIGEVAGWSVDALRDAVTRCWEFDKALKRGLMPNQWVALEQVIVGLCLGTEQPVVTGSRPETAPL